MNAENYSITITRLEDGLYRATIAELPDAEDFADTRDEAYELAIDTIETTATIMAEKHKPMPQPRGEHLGEFSGRVTLRMPKSLHSGLHHIAEREGSSLNQLICNVLASYQGFDYGLAHRLESWGKLATRKLDRGTSASETSRVEIPIGVGGSSPHSDWIETSGATA